MIIFIVRSLPWSNSYISYTADSLKSVGEVFLMEFEDIQSYYDYNYINGAIEEIAKGKYVCIIDAGMVLNVKSNFNMSHLNNLYCLEIRNAVLISRVLIYKYNSDYIFYGKFKPKIRPVGSKIGYSSDIVFCWSNRALRSIELHDKRFFKEYCVPKKLTANSPSFNPKLPHNANIVKSPKSVLTSDFLYYYYLTRDKRILNKSDFNLSNRRTVSSIESINCSADLLPVDNKFNYVRAKSYSNVYKPSLSILKMSALNDVMLHYKYLEIQINPKIILQSINHYTDSTQILYCFSINDFIYNIQRIGERIYIYQGKREIFSFKESLFKINLRSIHTNANGTIISYLEDNNLVTIDSTNISTPVFLFGVLGRNGNYIYCRDYIYYIDKAIKSPYSQNIHYITMMQLDYNIVSVAAISQHISLFVLKVSRNTYKIALCDKCTIKNIYNDVISVPTNLEVLGVNISKNKFNIYSSNALYSFKISKGQSIW